MNANKTITAIFTSTNPSSQIIHEETRTGGSSDTTFVQTSASLTAISGQLYLAAISTKPKVNVLSITGLGLSWSLVKAQCSGRNATGVEVWKAQGMPTSNTTVAAMLASESDNAVIAVSRYSGVDGVTPIGNVISGNTNGANGLCASGVDTNLYSFNLVTATNGAMVYGAAAMRSKNHTPGTGYTERAEIHQGSASSTTASVAVEDKGIASASTVTVNGTFNSKVDWAVVALEMKPKMKLTTNTVGSGSVTLNPPGGNYDAGTTVTLTVTPASGFQFSGWSGDVSGSSNPATITMNGNKTVTATFTALPPAQYTLTINKIGSGSVTLNPPGGMYDTGTVVTLTATPASGFQFSNWSGDLTGIANPATITMNGNKTVTANFSLIPAPIVHEETQTGGATNSTTVMSANLVGVNGHLYLAAISMRPKTAVLSVTGLGMNWTLVKSKCAGRNTTAIEVWMAQGPPNPQGAVTATLASATTAVIAVSRYSGAAASNPLGNVIAGNSNGLNAAGACSGGIDGSAYSFNLTTTVNNAMVYGAVAIKGQAHTAGAGYAERGEIQQPNGANPSGVAVEDQTIAAPAAIAVTGSFSNAVDWSVIAVEIKPQIVSPYMLTVNTTGSGSVALNPAGGVYNPGAAVTLTATATAGYQFSSWSGDLSGSSNPATITMNGNKTIAAIFTPSGSIVHEETRTGGASNSAIVKTSANLTGVSDHLYLAAISMRPKTAVLQISGLGLNWTLVKSKCAGRNTTAIEVWKAIGEPSSDDTVEATLASAPATAVIAVSRYSGVNVANPLGNVIAGNTNGLNAAGACSGGVDGSSYSFNLTTTVNNAVVYGAAAIKGRTHTPGADYTERGEVSQLSGANTCGLAIEDKLAASASTVIANGSFNDLVDWSVVALEIKPETLAKKGLIAENGKPSASPSAYQLYQNFPNPFNPSTKIGFSLPQASRVTIKVYTIDGAEVKTLVDAEYPAGAHAVVFKPKNLPSGAYFYVMQAGEARKVRQLLLLK
jgi:hypothetical protein